MDGYGKTNMLCNLAYQNVLQNPTLFITGRSGISEDVSIIQLLESKLNRIDKSVLMKENTWEHLVTITKQRKRTIQMWIYKPQ